MKFTIWSDLHGNNYWFDEIEKQDDVILLIPGDFDEVKHVNRYKESIIKLCEKFHSVILTPGNHEYYSSNIIKTHRVLKSFDSDIENFHFLQDDSIIINDCLIIGSTLWTDFNKGNPNTKTIALFGMNDYRYIRHGTEYEPWKRKLTPTDVEIFHEKSRNFIKETIDKYRDVCNNIKIVVMTHHAPSELSVSLQYKNDEYSPCYYSNMEYFIYETSPDLWVHGHIHSKSDYMLDKTRIICNPFGYDITENNQFDKNIIVEI